MNEALAHSQAPALGRKGLVWGCGRQETWPEDTVGMREPWEMMPDTLISRCVCLARGHNIQFKKQFYGWWGVGLFSFLTHPSN